MKLFFLKEKFYSLVIRLGVILKTEFEFSFSTYDFVFKKEHKYIAAVDEQTADAGNRESIGIESFEFKIVPDDKLETSGEAQRGSLFITLPIDPDCAEDKMWHLLHTIIEKINFNNPGKFEVNTSFYMGKRIPENEKEEKEVGDKPYYLKMSCVEYLDEPGFDSSSFVDMSSNTNDIVLIQQHNHASNLKHAIDKFVSYYKIIEDVFSTNKKIPAKKLLLESKPLRDIYYSAFNIKKTNDDYKCFIDDIVNIRHKCSHLNRNSNFGYVLNDERIESEVKGYLDLLDYVTKEVILVKNQPRHP